MKKEISVSEASDYFSKLCYEKPYSYRTFVNAYKLEINEPLIQELINANILKIISTSINDGKSRISLNPDNSKNPVNHEEVIEQVYKYLYDRT
jgi:hypothetical protein